MADAVTHIKEDILQTPGNLLQLFTLNHDFSTEWHSFVAENNDAKIRDQTLPKIIFHSGPNP